MTNFDPLLILRASARARTAEIMVATGASYADVAEAFGMTRMDASVVLAWINAHATDR